MGINMNDFITWKGGICPIDSESYIEFKLRDGTVGKCYAHDLEWGRDVNALGDDVNSYWNVMAYRVVE